MTGKERLMAILSKQPADRLSWTTLVDEATLQWMPEALRGNGGLDLYRHLGCDVCLLNNWGTPHAFPRSVKWVWPEDVVVSGATDGDVHRQTYKTRQGSLTSASRRGRSTKRLLETIEEVRIYRDAWERLSFVKGEDDTPAFRATEQLIGVDGIATCFPGPSAIPSLLEYTIGIENFYYLLNDHPQELEALIRVIHEREMEMWRILAQGPWAVAILCENTSTYYISPDIYRRFNGPHQKDFVDIMHATGKIALIHMCGHVLALLPEIKKTGADGIHALTPPPVGNTPWETALDALGDDLVIMGVLDPTVFVSGPVDDIPKVLDRVYTPRLRRSNFVLWAAADGLPIPLERFEAVARWFARQT
jgi:hypothetical protein